MVSDDAAVTDKCELRPVVGLTRGLPASDIEILAINAIRLHRQLVEKADQRFQALPEDYKTGKAAGGAQHLAYIESAIEMHAQMAVVNTLLYTLGYIPKLTVN